ncbi:MAG: cytochrome C [Betaproteobacteria bacterium RIFCSPLOWO2_02_FULL_67_26]|nr:MAG: cytochrome C [Betaproteobacteria bacterium RIFCSPLOWO2_02_FULL_67_26]
MWIPAGLLVLAGMVQAQPAAPAAIDNAVCLGCHGNEGFSVPGANGRTRSLHVIADKFGKSVHGKRQCVECHKDITAIPHEKTGPLKVGCVQCHQDLWEAAKKDNKAGEFPRLGVVVEQIDHYMKSIHARPSREDQSRTNATCYNCHDAHYVYPKDSPIRADWRLGIPNACGKCHVKQREEYLESVHGGQVIGNANPAAPVCSDCHTTHDVDRPKLDAIKLVISKNCGNCHSENLKSYANTYHGQITTLGYAYTATCFDCHGSHGIQRVSHPLSTVHPNNRLRTCQKCHKDATAGFVSFQPHANTHDYARYPYMWIASKFMIGLIAGVFLFFWTHCALWFYREYRDRKEGKTAPHVRVADLPHLKGRHFQRFRPLWRLAHLLFALSLMILSLTGMAVFYAETAWAAAVMNALGGPKVAAVIHRTAGVVILGIFLAQLFYFIYRLAPQWRTFNWFGHTSLIPGLQDLKDIIAMFKWFLGKAPRPVFGRWTYWERFDYWAPFWGLTIVGGSGLMIWFKELTAAVWPGWIFNVAALAHGEEAFLAIVFLFTVHFFNNHFRPDKLPPPDIVMFTGTQSLEDFAREHTLEYQELVKSGALEKHLVDAPSPQMTLGSRILGIVLLIFGLILLALVLIGFAGSLRG